jgi:hypothetical protein
MYNHLLVSNRGASSPPYYFQSTLRQLAEGVQGEITGIPSSTVTHLLFAGDLSLTSTHHNELQTMLTEKKKLRW